MVHGAGATPMEDYFGFFLKKETLFYTVIYEGSSMRSAKHGILHVTRGARRWASLCSAKRFPPCRIRPVRCRSAPMRVLAQTAGEKWRVVRRTRTRLTLLVDDAFR